MSVRDLPTKNNLIKLLILLLNKKERILNKINENIKVPQVPKSNKKLPINVEYTFK